MLGLATTGLYSNYYMVAKYTYSLAMKIMKPMQATIGNYLYSKTSDKDKIVLLETLNTGAFIFACFICNMNKYWKNQVKKIGLLCLQLFVTHLLTRNLGITIQDCIIREMIVILFLIVNIFWFFTPRWLKGWYCRH